jgi:hypothetical protein
MPTLTLSARYFRLYPPEQFLGHATRQFVVDTAEAALLLVDVYGRGFDPQGGDPSSWSGLVSPQSASHEADIVCRHVRPAVDAARSSGLPVVYAANSAPAVALERSAYEEMKCDTLQFDTATMYAEQSVEIPGIDEPGKWTERWITYVESCIGYSLTSAEFIAECARARPIT